MAVLFGARPHYKELGITNIAGACLEEPLDLGDLDVASVRMATPTVCCRTPVRNPVLAEVDAARKRQPIPRANLDTMVCKFL
ncbi:hypothetical protein Trydic_g9779 [Trypoxylus dichotomus]